MSDEYTPDLLQKVRDDTASKLANSPAFSDVLQQQHQTDPANVDPNDPNFNNTIGDKSAADDFRREVLLLRALDAKLSALGKAKGNASGTLNSGTGQNLKNFRFQIELTPAQKQLQAQQEQKDLPGAGPAEINARTNESSQRVSELGNMMNDAVQNGRPINASTFAEYNSILNGAAGHSVQWEGLSDILGGATILGGGAILSEPGGLTLGESETGALLKKTPEQLLEPQTKEISESEQTPHNAEVKREPKTGNDDATSNATKRGEPVVVRTGEYVESWEDFRIDGTIPIIAQRYYGHQSKFSGPLGSGRISIFDVVFTVAGRELVYHDEQGSRIHFDRPFGFEPSFNNKHRHLQLRAPWLKELELRDRRTKRLFHQGKDKVYRLVAIEDFNGNRVMLNRSAQGLLDSAEHSDGFSLRFENDSSGLRRSVTLRCADGAEKRLVDYTYDRRANLSSVECATSFSILYDYDEQDRIRSWRDASRRSEIRILYDQNNRVCKTETNGSWNNDAFEYDDRTRTTVYRPGGIGPGERFVHDESGNLIEQIDPLGNSRKFEYEEGYLTAEIDPLGNRTEYRYDQYGNIRQITDPEGRNTFYRSGSKGELYLVVDQPGNATKFAYDAHGNLVTLTNPLGALTRLEWTAAGRLERIIYPEGAIEQRNYDSHHRLIELVDAAGRRTRLERDAFGRVAATIDPLGGRTELEYGESKSKPFTEPTVVRRTDRVESRRFFDQDGQLSLTIDGENRRTVYQYGPWDQLAGVTDPKGGQIRLSYDVQGRIELVANPQGSVYRYERDLAGRVTAEIDFDSRRIEYEYDAANRLVEKRNADGSRIAYDYDRSGRLLSTCAFAAGSNEPEELTRYQYDRRGLLIHAENKSAVIELERDGTGRIVAETTNGRRIESSYDSCGRRVERRIGTLTKHGPPPLPRPGDLEALMIWSPYPPPPTFSAEQVTCYGYDARGLLEQLKLGKHDPLLFQRDALGREVERTVGTDFRSVHSSPHSSFRLRQSYDSVGQLTEQNVDWPGGLGAGPEMMRGAGTLQRRYQWNKAFEPLSVAETLWGKTDYQYDANGQVINAHREGTVHRHLTEYGGGNGFSGQRGGELEEFQYNQARDIVASGSITDFDAPANRDRTAAPSPWHLSRGGKVNQAYGPNAQRILLKHDAQGRVIERRVERDGWRPQTWKFEWNAHDRLITCWTRQGIKWRYDYDPFGRRIAKRKVDVPPVLWDDDTSHNLVNGVPFIGGKTYLPEENSADEVGRSYLWDGDVLAEDGPLLRDGQTGWGKAVRWHYQGFIPIAREENDRLHYVLTDHLGTPRECFSEQGTLAWAANYRTWGEVYARWQSPQLEHPATEPANALFRGNTTKQESKTDFCPIRFQGQWEDQESGLRYNRFRYYDAEAVSYLSSDPIGLGGGVRSYGYVQNPLTWIDPLGLDPFGTGRAPHTATVTVTDSAGNVTFQDGFQSGNMTPEEAALGFPQSTLATHTEARAVSQVPLNPGDSMLIEGQYAPCPTCKGRMNTRAAETGASIKYTWPQNGEVKSWSANSGGTK
jgi:RHS repeat-associated protein